MPPRAKRRRKTAALPEKVAKAAKEAGPDEVQKAIDKWAEDGKESVSYNDSPADAGTAAKNAEKIVREDPAFAEAYAKSAKVGKAYLSTKNKHGLVPPNCELHPKLGVWGLKYMGKWMLIRWLDTRQRVKQKRNQQGWQYFEGPKWAPLLGLVWENFKNEKGRYQTIDAELAWIAEEYVKDKRDQVNASNKNWIKAAADNLVEQSDGRYITNVSVLEGSEEEVRRELSSRKNFAERRA